MLPPLDHPHFRPRAVLLLGVLAALMLGAGPSSARINLPPETQDDPPAPPRSGPPEVSAASTIVFGRFTSRQVNVNAFGANILHDAANEPSIAVDPFDHNHIAIGWRQFDSVGSNFRQAGFGYTTDGGVHWTSGKIEPGVFRSDPVLGSDAEGDFFYLSLDNNFHSWLFPSTNHGMSWGVSTFAYGGDKQWMTFDRRPGPGLNHVYQAWQTSGNNYFPNTFDRSLDDGETFQPPSTIPSMPIFGTVDVSSDGTVYVVGDDGTGNIVVARSTDARDGGIPTWTTVPADLGGSLEGGTLPNPAGLLGQAWIAVDRTLGPRAGWIYVLASVNPGSDPLDVRFTRSTDGGATWSPSIRVNDDPAGTQAVQWFGTMSVSPDGRIDAVWNDSRGSADIKINALYYTYSLDGGTTWSPNEQATPTWDSTVGWPNQNKIGDYYHMVSDVEGADLAYAATFNNEQDVYYLRIPAPSVAASASPEASFRLWPTSPNPFRASTAFRFDVPPEGARVTLDVLDVSGRRVATLVDGFRAGGMQMASWDGRDESGQRAAPGVYVCRYRADGRTETRRLALLR